MVFEIGARAAALAGAYIAHVDDASAIYYNPAGMVFLKGVRVKTNILFSSLATTASQDTGVNYESNLLQIRGAHFLAWNLSNRLSIGLGIFNPYIAETNWMEENPYSYITKFNVITIRPAFALKLLDGLSVGFGIDFDIATLDWAHSLEYWPEPYRLYLYRGYYEVSGSGMGFVAGIFWKIGSKFQIGGRYQHLVKSNLSGTYYTRSGLGLPFSSVTGSIILPAELALGLKFVPLDNLAMCLDFHWSSWNKTKGWTLQFDEKQEHWSPDIDDFWINALIFTRL